MFNYASITNTRRALAVLIFLVALSPFVTVVRDFNKAEDKKLEALPAWDLSCMLSVREEVLARFLAEPTNPIEYFEVLELSRQLERAFRRGWGGGMLWATGTEIRERQMLGAMIASIPGITHKAQERYYVKFNPRTMIEVSKLYYTHFNRPWDGVKIQWSQNLSWQFVSAFLWIGLLSFLSTFLAFWDAGNLRVFPRRLPLIIPMAFTVGPLTPRWAGADRSLVASDVWLMTSFATATVSLFMPGVVVVVKAQAPTTAKAKQSGSRTANQTDGAENSGQGINNLLPALKRLSINQVDAEVLPGATGALREVAIEAAGGWNFGKNGNNGKGTFFTFVETRQKVFFNNSVAFFPWSQRIVAPTAEFGYNQTARAGFMSAGGKVVLTKAPGLRRVVGKAFDFAAISYLHKVSGAAPKQQLLFAYDTRALPLNSWLKVVGSGFWRYRMRTAINYGQQTVRFQVGSWKRFEPIIQFDTAGKTVGVSVGVKLYLFPVR